MLISLGLLTPLFFFHSIPKIDLVFIFIVVSCLVKRAQLPFSVWLPAAMSAPTPVSSLVHSSTLVTAGIYIILRLYFYLSDGLKFFLFLIGLATLMLSSVSTFGEINIKKIIALSTIGHIGLIVMLLGYSLPYIAFYHLLRHSFFKCSLFMFSGFFLHSAQGNLDIRFLRGNNRHIRFLFCYGVLANLCLLCIPFRSGFFSKDIRFEAFIRKKIFFFLFCFYSAFYLFKGDILS